LEFRKNPPDVSKTDKKGGKRREKPKAILRCYTDPEKDHRHLFRLRGPEGEGGSFSGQEKKKEAGELMPGKKVCRTGQRRPASLCHHPFGTTYANQGGGKGRELKVREGKSLKIIQFCKPPDCCRMNANTIRQELEGVKNRQ